MKSLCCECFEMHSGLTRSILSTHCIRMNLHHTCLFSEFTDAPLVANMLASNYILAHPADRKQHKHEVRIKSQAGCQMHLKYSVCLSRFCCQNAPRCSLACFCLPCCAELFFFFLKPAAASGNYAESWDWIQTTMKHCYHGSLQLSIPSMPSFYHLIPANQSESALCAHGTTL